MCQEAGRCVVMYSTLANGNNHRCWSDYPGPTHQGCPMWGMDTNKSFLYLPYAYDRIDRKYWLFIIWDTDC